MKTSFAVILAVSLFGCGRIEVEGVDDPNVVPLGGEEAASSEVSSEVSKGVLGATLTAYARGVLAGDAQMVLGVLSSERLARIESAGGIERVMEEQAQQLKRAFGETVDFSSRGFEVSSVESLGSPDVLSATFSLDGRLSSKPVYFVLENGQYKVNLRPPERPVMPSAPAGTARQAVVLAPCTYKISNYGGTTELARLRTTTSSSFSSPVSVAPSATVNVTGFADNCPNIFLDGTDFQGTNNSGMFFQIALRCAYQWVGDDFFRPSGSIIWACTQTC